MRIHEIIKKKRLELHLTQEQLAQYIGVSAPAVSKWERGTTYPDISLLPPLARLLKVDLNTLLSFNDEPSDEEIWAFIHTITTTMHAESYDALFQQCMDKIHEYPTCDKLRLHLAIQLTAGLQQYGLDNTLRYEETLNAMYESCANSGDLEIRNQAISMLSSRYIGEKNYDMAQKYLDMLPDTAFKKAQRQGHLYFLSGALDKASALYEGNLLEATSEIFISLLSMMELALKENRVEDAFYFVEVIEKATVLFELWEYRSLSAHFQLYTGQKNEEKLLDTLAEMLYSLKNTTWSTRNTRLYKHIKEQTINPEQLLQEQRTQALTALVTMLKNDVGGSLQFVKETPRFTEIMQQYTD